nr:unnamed protein product [Spirometra erinaceieuropaei]
MCISVHPKAYLEAIWRNKAVFLATETCRCPIGCNHWIPKISLTRHVQSCRLRSKGYSKKEIAAFWPQDCEQITAGSTQAEERKEDLLMLHSTTLLNLSESAAHKSLKSGPETSISARTPTAQELAFVRDLKRRRRSYRGVHTAKRSYIDVLREVISHHTELLRDGSFEQPQSAADTPPSSSLPNSQRIHSTFIIFINEVENEPAAATFFKPVVRSGVHYHWQ